MTYCPRCGTWSESNFCPNCGQQLVDLRYPHETTYPAEHTVPQPSRNGGGARAAVAIVLLLLIIGGAWLYFSQPHGSPGSPLGCVPHQETVYVGYIHTATENYQITEGQRITQFSYDKGLLLYTVYLTSDQGQHFEYHYVTSFDLEPTTVTTGC
jgi:hypothetical protein